MSRFVPVSLRCPASVAALAVIALLGVTVMPSYAGQLPRCTASGWAYLGGDSSSIYVGQCPSKPAPRADSPAAAAPKATRDPQLERETNKPTQPEAKGEAQGLSLPPQRGGAS